MIKLNNIFLALLCLFTAFVNAQNTADGLINLALLNEAIVTSNVASGRGVPTDILYNPQTNAYESSSNYVEHGVTYNVNLGTPTRGNGFNWQVEWNSLKTINYITFGGTYPNQPQPNTLWAISYFNGTSWVTIEEGSGDWIDSGTYEWGGPDQVPIHATKILLEIYSDGSNNLVSIHIRGRGSSTNIRDDSDNPIKACLIQYLPSNGTDTESPSVPNNLSSTINTDTTADLNWNNSTDNVTVTGYKIYKDGVLESTLGNVTTHQVTGLTASTNYDFTVTAFDAVGNEGAYSNTITVATNSSGGSTGGSTVWSESSGNIFYTAGNVGIGIDNPDAPLTVKGKIHTNEVLVDVLAPIVPDYVFKKEYNLKTLEEVQLFINEHGHLPNIPSAEEFAKKGMELKAMNLKLLEKIEELTLYILEQEKSQKALDKRIKILETKRRN